MDIHRQIYLQTKPNNYDYSIIIPTYNSKKTLLKLLNSIFETKGRERYEVIVVDDASTDETYQAIKDYPVKIMTSPQNKGSAHARNIGAYAAQSPYIIFFDADIILQPNTLDLLIKCIKGQPENHVYMGIYSDIPVEKNIVSEYKALLDSYHWKQVKKIEVTSFEPRCAIMKKTLFEKSGGFDERITGADVEDYELGYRLLDLNARLLVNPDICVYHHFPTSINKLLRSMFHRTQSWIKLFKHRKKFDNVASTPESALACGISGLSGLLIPAIGFDYAALIGFICLISLFVFLCADFWVYAFHKRGYCLALTCVCLHYFVCMVVFWGAMTGLLSRTKNKPILSISGAISFTGKY